jgi:hypothetical protein
LSAYNRLLQPAGDATLNVALASLEYSRATGRLSGSIASRNHAHLPIDIVVQYSMDNGRTFADAYAQLLFGATDPSAEFDIYAFSLRASSLASRFARDPAQQIHLRVTAKYGGDVLALDDNNGRLYVCKAVPASIFACL